MQGQQPFYKLIITASGGPFRTKTLDDIKNATVKETLNHPNWNMGKKITVDSATLMNKGLEVIEAHHLFGAKFEDIKISNYKGKRIKQHFELNSSITKLLTRLNEFKSTNEKEDAMNFLNRLK